MVAGNAPVVRGVMNGEECFRRGCRRRRQRASGHTLGSLLIQRAERGRAEMPKQHKEPTGRRWSVKGPVAKSGAEDFRI